MIERIYGINVAVKDLDEASKRYQQILGVEPRPMPANVFAFPNLRGAAFWLGNTVIHLITSETEDTAVAKFLSTRGEGVFLISLLSDNAAEDVQTLRERGAQMALPENVTGLFGEVNFIHPRSMHGAQFEVLQPAEAPGGGR